MRNNLFTPSDILLPKDISLTDWSVVACDQYSSERDYWDRVSERVGDKPSTLRLTIPEVYLGSDDDSEMCRRVYEAMDNYLEAGIFRVVPNSFIYLERTLTDGRVRRGIIGALDLEQYDFSGGDAAVLASEGTVLDRLPTRVKVRRGAKLELTHIIAFINDKDDKVIGDLSKKTDSMQLLYDFELMENGGRVRARQVTGAEADCVVETLGALSESGRALMIIGDGNHSLAAAKLYWDELKQTLTGDERENHPARRAILEVSNVYDSAINFEAIHRVVFNTNTQDLLEKLKKAIPSGDDYSLEWYSGNRSGTISAGAACIGDMIKTMQDCLDEHIRESGCGIDYIHGAETAKSLASPDNALALVLPSMEKHELFETVYNSGVFPRKSFSVGHAHEKRFYMECRKIR